jgi:hypothetical protein
MKSRDATQLELFPLPQRKSVRRKTRQELQNDFDIQRSRRTRPATGKPQRQTLGEINERSRLTRD